MHLADIQAQMKDRNIKSIVNIAFNSIMMNGTYPECQVKAPKIMGEILEERFGKPTKEQFYAAIHLLENKLEREPIEVENE